MNADHEEAVEFAKISKRENRVYVGNLSYEVRYRDLMEFMRGGGWGNPDPFSLNVEAQKWLRCLLACTLWGKDVGGLKSSQKFWPGVGGRVFLSWF
jgi:hypothetical protein